MQGDEVEVEEPRSGYLRLGWPVVHTPSKSNNVEGKGTNRIHTLWGVTWVSDRQPDPLDTLPSPATAISTPMLGYEGQHHCLPQLTI